MANEDILEANTRKSSMSSSGSNKSSPNHDRKGSFQNSGRNESQDPDVVKMGYLQIKRPPSSIKIRLKAWQKKFFVLRDVCFEDGVSTLEMYENEAAFNNNSPIIEFSLDLKNVNGVDSYNQSKRFPHAFMVLRKGQTPLVLAATCVLDKNSWMEAINVLANKRQLVYKYKDFAVAGEQERRASFPFMIQYKVNPIYTTMSQSQTRENSLERPCSPCTPLRSDGPPTPPRHNSVQSNSSQGSTGMSEFLSAKCQGQLVSVQHSFSASKNNLIGEYYMNVCPGYITLTNVESLKEVINWPIDHITKFKSEDLKTGENLVTLEATMFCGAAEGSYYFKTMHGKELIKKVKDAATSVRYITNNTPPISRQMDNLRKKSDASTPSSPQKLHIPENEMRADLTHCARDSGFSDSDNDDPKPYYSIDEQQTNTKDDSCQNCNTKNSENKNHTTTATIVGESKTILYTEIAQLDEPPPLPPKTRNNKTHIVFLDYEELKALPAAPPVPDRQK